MQIFYSFCLYFCCFLASISHWRLQRKSEDAIEVVKKKRKEIKTKDLALWHRRHLVENLLLVIRNNFESFSRQLRNQKCLQVWPLFSDLTVPAKWWEEIIFLSLIHPWRLITSLYGGKCKLITELPCRQKKGKKKEKDQSKRNCLLHDVFKCPWPSLPLTPHISSPSLAQAKVS